MTLIALSGMGTIRNAYSKLWSDLGNVCIWDFLNILKYIKWKRKLEALMRRLKGRYDVYEYVIE